MKWLVAVWLLTLVACKSGQKIENVDTQLEDKSSLGAGESVGKNADGKYVVQKKESLVSYLRELQQGVHSQELEIYGNPAFGNKGKHGVLEDCRITLRAKVNGKWELPEPVERVLVTEDESKITKTVGVDEKGRLIHLQEEDLLARIKRFERYKRTYTQQANWFDTEIKNCKVQLNNYQEMPKDKPTDFPDLQDVKNQDLNAWLCESVELEMPLSKVVAEAVKNGWLYEDDLADLEYVNGSTATDGTKFRRENVLKLGSWSLAFNRLANYGALANKETESYLKAWYNPNPQAVQNSERCLAKNKTWNTSRR